ncbi:hypothetical protein KJ854_04695, partial [Patescibacteria group bacterium]|nr:hypothetical protein [Patescibacteria group bacterium]
LWVGVFRKYERKAADDGKNSELIEAGEKLKNDIESKIKMSELPKVLPSISPEASPEVSSEIIPEAM